MPKKHELWQLEMAVDSLEYLLRQENFTRDEVRNAVHAVSEAYLNWAFELDNAQLEVVGLP